MYWEKIFFVIIFVCSSSATMLLLGMEISDSSKPLSFKDIPIELVNRIFQFCNPLSKGLNYLIHIFEPTEQIMIKIVCAKIAYEFEKFVLTRSNLGGNCLKENEDRAQKRQMKINMIKEIMKFHQCTEKLHEKCQSSLKPLLDLETMVSSYENKIELLELTIQASLKEVKITAALLQWPEEENSENYGFELFLNPEVDNYLRFHRVYLKHCNWLLKNRALMLAESYEDRQEIVAKAYKSLAIGPRELREFFIAEQETIVKTLSF